MKIGLPHIAACWDNTVHKFPRLPAVVHGEQSLTYRQADELIGRIAGCLADCCGVNPGDRVALAMGNRLEYFLLYWATLRLGAVAAPVNTRLRADELGHVLRNCEARAVATDEQTHEGVCTALAAEGLQPSVVCTSQEPGRAVPFGELADYTNPRDTFAADSASPAVLLHTSGTTGVPKGALMRHEDLRFNISQAILAHSLRHEDRHLLAIPLFAPTAAYSLLPAAAYQGSTIVIAGAPQPKELAALIETHRCTTFVGVPTMLHLFLHDAASAKADLSSLRLIAYSGSPMPPATIMQLRERFPGVALHNFFGLTETISITHVLPDCEALTRPGSIGALLPEVYARITDDEGRDVPDGEIGELCFHRSNVIPCYWNRPGLLDEAFLGEWFQTGDFARVDEEGYFYVEGRKKEMIIVAGQNVYANEVERVIVGCDGVREAAVVGIAATGARAALGELVKAVVVLQPGAELTERDIKRHCAGLLPSYKVPQVVCFIDDLPRNASGKVLKNQLRGETPPGRGSAPAPRRGL